MADFLMGALGHYRSFAEARRGTYKKYIFALIDLLRANEYSTSAKQKERGTLKSLLLFFLASYREE
jgi:hypothetical protein